MQGLPRRLTLVDRLLAVLRDGHGDLALHARLQQERARLGRQVQTGSDQKSVHEAPAPRTQSFCPSNRCAAE